MASSSVSQWALLQQLLECLLSVAPFDCNWRCVGDVQHCRALSFLRADMHTEREREREHLLCLMCSQVSVSAANANSAPMTC